MHIKMSDFRKILFRTLPFVLSLLNLSSETKVSIDIDSFLKRVIASEQFDAIADKIADKAAEKITHMNGYELKTEDNEFKLNDSSTDEPTYRVSENATNITTEAPQSNEADNIVESTTIKDAVIKYTIREIAKGLNNDKKVPTDGLVLKFKHFTKNKDANDALDGKSQNDETLNDDSNQEKTENGISNSNVKYNEQQSKSNEIGGDISDTNKYKSSELLITSNENNVNETTEKPAEEEDKIQEMTFKSRDAKSLEATESEDPDSLNLEFEENFKAFIEYQNQQREEDSFNKNPLRTQESRSTEEVGIVLDHESSFEENLTSTTVASTTSQELKTKHKNKIDTRTAVRQEGDKLFTYEKSPDYEEYHEELSRKMTAKH